MLATQRNKERHPARTDVRPGRNDHLTRLDSDAFDNAISEWQSRKIIELWKEIELAICKAYVDNIRNRNDDNTVEWDVLGLSPIGLLCLRLTQ